MPRRRPQDDGMSFDSLMDTLTNVVGILLIILVFTVLGGQEAVKRIKGFVDEISQEQLETALAESAELRSTVKDQRERWREFDHRLIEDRLRLERQQELAAQLRADIDKLSESQIDPEALEQQLTQRRTRVSELETEIAEKSDLIAQLKARLADSPAVGPDPSAKVVRLPDPRPAPKGARPVVFVCRHGRIMPVEKEKLQQQAQQVVFRGRARLIKGDRLDCEELTKRFDQTFVGDRSFRLRIRIAGDAKPHLVLEHREEAGVSTEELARANSRFHQLLRRLSPERQYLDFRVFANSFDTYLAARSAAARAGFAAGWTPYADNAEYSIPLQTDLQTLCLGKEPPKPSPAPPADPDRPPPPSDVVD